MKILAIDTALPAVSACVWESGAETAEASETIAMQRGHAEALVPLIDRVVAQSEGGFAALDRVAVTVGPGSFTGLRVGIAAARAIGLACHIPVVGVSTLAALAAPLLMERKPGVIGVAIDARHGLVYLSAFGPDGKALVPPQIVSVPEALRLMGGDPLRLAGSGAPMLAIAGWSLGRTIEIATQGVAPDIAFVAKLGLVADPRAAPPRPLYLKPPDATPQASPFAPADSA